MEKDREIPRKTRFGRTPLDPMAKGVSRRQVLQWLAIAAASTGLESCRQLDAPRLRVATLQGAMPGSVWRDFGRLQSLDVIPVALDSRPALFDRLVTPYPQQRSNASQAPNPESPDSELPDPTAQASLLERGANRVELSLLGADWLDEAIARDAIVPIPEDMWGERFGQLPPLWQQAAMRQGKLWGLPWSWGVTAIAYNRRLVSEPIADWGDLWRSSLKGKVVLPDRPRDVIGLTLKSLGKSYNTSLATVPEMGDRLAALNAQALTYSSEFYLQSAFVGDATAVVGWTSDLYQLPQVNSRFEIVIPTSGTALWWDLWVVPRQRNFLHARQIETGTDFPGLKGETVAAWFDFALRADVVRRTVATARSPLAASISPERLPDTLRDRPVFAENVLARSELLEPLSAEEAVAYLSLWETMRRANPA